MPLTSNHPHAGFVAAVFLSLAAMNPAELPAQTLAAADAETGARLRAQADAIRPHLVGIETWGATESPQAAGAASPAGPLALDASRQTIATGLVISPQGEVLTSLFNLSHRPAVVTVIIPSGERRVASLVAIDHTRLLCLLRYPPGPGDSFLVLPLADPATVRVGQSALAVGLGYSSDQPAVSLGIISATGRCGGRAIQTDAKLSPANFGGVLLNGHGEILGICTPLSADTAHPLAGAQWYDSGVGFAIPLDATSTAAWLPRLQRGEAIHPGRIGIRLATQIAGDDASKMLRITHILADSPAQAAGLQPGDRLASADGRPLRDVTDLHQAVNRHSAGETLELEIEREGKLMKFIVTLAVLAGKEDVTPPAVLPTAPFP